MSTETKDFTLRVDGVKGFCPTGNEWAERHMRQGAIPVLACEGPCVRGDIARRAANFVAKEEPYARACFPEAFFVPHSSMSRWVREADQVVMIDGCFLKCIGRVLNNVVEDKGKVVHIDALPFYNKYEDLFDMDDVPEAERVQTARKVADKILAGLKETREPGARTEQDPAHTERR